MFNLTCCNKAEGANVEQIDSVDVVPALPAKVPQGAPAEPAPVSAAPKPAVDEPTKNVEPKYMPGLIQPAKDFQHEIVKNAGIVFDSSSGNCDRQCLTILKVTAIDGTTSSLMHGDRIMEADGATDISVILSKLEASTPVKCRIYRPATHSIQLERTGTSAKIGCVVRPSGEQSLLVKEIKAGMVQDWNTANPKQPVGVGDRIVEINGVKGEAKALLSTVGDATVTQLRLTISQSVDEHSQAPVRAPTQDPVKAPAKAPVTAPKQAPKQAPAKGHGHGHGAGG